MSQQQILNALALSAFVALGIYSVYDVDMRLHFAEVCKLILATYIGYLIPTGK
jgi:hypothetical protein